MTLATRPSRSLLPRRERLGTVADPDPDTHLIHAAYPSATRTLCTLPTAGGEPGGPAPTCPVCSATAALWEQIDLEGW